MSLAQSFANLKVRKKVVSGFALVLAILAAVGGIGAISIGNIGRGFDTYDQRAHVTDIAGDIQAGILKLRRHVREFALTGKGRRGEKGARRVARAEGSDRSRTRHHQIAGAAQKGRRDLDAAHRLREGFQARRGPAPRGSQLQSEVLDPSGLKLREDFDHMAAAAMRAGNAPAQIQILTATEAMMQARLDVNKAIARHEEALVAKAEATIRSSRPGDRWPGRRDGVQWRAQAALRRHQRACDQLL